jgi:hypothetical protein
MRKKATPGTWASDAVSLISCFTEEQAFSDLKSRVVGNPYLGIISELPVTRAQSRDAL